MHFRVEEYYRQWKYTNMNLIDSNTTIDDTDFELNKFKIRRNNNLFFLSDIMHIIFEFKTCWTFSSNMIFK